MENQKDKELIKLASRIKQLREKAGYSSYEVFAYEKGFSRSLYWSYEKGANITYLNLLKLIDAFGVTQEEFFSEGFE